MLKDILETLKAKEYNNIIYTFDIKSEIKESDKEYINNNFQINNIKDVRSATFYALGKENLHKNCIILVNGDDLQSTLTGITETWFQKLNIFVIALYKKYDDIKTDFIRRVMPNIIKIYDEDFSEYEPLILKAIAQCTPSLITLKYDIVEIKYDYNDFIKLLSKILKNGDEVFCYNSNNMLENNFNIKSIKSKYKYCIISKYMGYIIGTKKKSLLCMPAMLLLLDLNILNNRYINENFKVILFNVEEIKEDDTLEKWIENNNIKSKCINKIDENVLNEFWNLEEPAILLVKGEI